MNSKKAFRYFSITALLLSVIFILYNFLVFQRELWIFYPVYIILGSGIYCSMVAQLEERRSFVSYIFVSSLSLVLSFGPIYFQHNTLIRYEGTYGDMIRKKVIKEIKNTIENKSLTAAHLLHIGSEYYSLRNFYTCLENRDSMVTPCYSGDDEGPYSSSFFKYMEALLKKAVLVSKNQHEFIEYYYWGLENYPSAAVNNVFGDVDYHWTKEPLEKFDNIISKYEKEQDGF